MDKRNGSKPLVTMSDNFLLLPDHRGWSENPFFVSELTAPRQKTAYDQVFD